jgi:uncharacterized protein (UPF0332 family)
VSPRSAEFLDAAVRRLAAARSTIDQDPAAAVSAAYYAMLYSARAALSERDIYAKTHAGTWHELRQVFVEPGLLDAGLVAEAQRVQRERERADYDAWPASEDEAQRVIELAQRLVDAVQSVIGEPPSDPQRRVVR